MRRACVVLFVLAGGCAPSGALAIGPTLDADRVIRLEGEAALGTTNGVNVTALGDPSHGATGVWSVGVRVALGAATRWSLSQGRVGGYIEYLRLGTATARWGFHAGLTIAVPFDRGKALVAVYAGPDRLAHVRSMDTGDGYATTFVTDGLDLSFRARLGSTGLLTTNWWQVGAFYVRRGSVLYE